MKALLMVICVFLGLFLLFRIHWHFTSESRKVFIREQLKDLRHLLPRYYV